MCSFLPASPARAVNRASMFMCTSSRPADHSKLPSLISLATASRPSTMASRSVAVSTPHWHNMRAWAIDPAISYWASRRSKCSDAVNASTAASVLSLKRPPQSFSALMIVTGVGTVLQYTLRVIRAACSKAALPKPGRAAAAGGPAVTAGPTYTMPGPESALPTGERRWDP